MPLTNLPDCFDKVVHLDRKIRSEKVVKLQDLKDRRRYRRHCAVFCMAPASPQGGGGGTPTAMMA